jgi:hypothetical protein
MSVRITLASSSQYCAVDGDVHPLPK